MPYYIDQEVIYKPQNIRATVRHIYPINLERVQEYRISLLLERTDKIVCETDLSPVSFAYDSNAFSTNIYEISHFTDARNIQSIRKYGLLSWEQLEMRKIPHIPASNPLSRELDLRKGLQSYVRLCSKPEHRMAYIAKQEKRVEELVWLKINPIVVRWKATLFSDRNATHRDAVINGSFETLSNSEHLEPEILIRDALSPKWIIF